MSRRVKRKADDHGLMYIGMDVHKEYIQAAVMDEQGSVVREERFSNAKDSIESFFKDIPHAS